MKYKYVEHLEESAGISHDNLRILLIDYLYSDGVGSVKAAQEIGVNVRVIYNFLQGRRIASKSFYKLVNFFIKDKRLFN
jgi:hypothetical protein